MKSLGVTDRDISLLFFEPAHRVMDAQTGRVIYQAQFLEAPHEFVDALPAGADDAGKILLTYRREALNAVAFI
jgi:hypothetical protein